MILHYTGPSMKPTLRVGDGLIVVPYGDIEIHTGDVVVFVPPRQKCNVVHRVISVDLQGIRTRGDNNSRPDPWVLSPDDIIGRVVSIQRRDRNIAIHAGVWGRIAALMLWRKKQIGSTVSRMLHPAYHWLAQSGIFRKTLFHRIKTRVFCFRRPNGMEMQLFMGQRIIGRRLPGRERWHIRRPFRLFVCEASLPQVDHNHWALS